MAEYIEREALMAKLDEEVKFYISDRTLKGNFAAGVLCDMRDGTISKFPAADVEPVRHGRWIYNIESGEYVCSVCDENALSFRKDTIYGGDLYEVCLTDYCPNCGAKMDEEAQQ